MFRADEPGLYHPAEAGGLRIGKRRRAPEALAEEASSSVRSSVETMPRSRGA